MQEPKESPIISKFRKLSRPRLNIPGRNDPTQEHPMMHIPVSAIPIGNVNGPFGLMHFYPSKASEYMNKRYEGFKDFTKNTAKSGLSFGEKILFWLNGRVRHLSKRWFTHIFLFLVVLVYSLGGAILFVTVEGSHEEKEKVDIHREFILFANNVRNMAQDQGIVYDRERWIRKFQELMAPYENQLLESFSHGVTPSEHKVWSFWNSLFYCGTIYTTIALYRGKFPVSHLGSLSFSRKEAAPTFGWLLKHPGYLTEKQWISFGTVRTSRSFLMTQLGTYHGGTSIIRKALNSNLSLMSMVDLEAESQIWMPYVQTGFNIALYTVSFRL